MSRAVNEMMPEFSSRPWLVIGPSQLVLQTKAIRSRFQSGEGPSRGLLRDCTTGCGTDGPFYSTRIYQLNRDNESCSDSVIVIRFQYCQFVDRYGTAPTLNQSLQPGYCWGWYSSLRLLLSYHIISGKSTLSVICTAKYTDNNKLWTHTMCF